MHRPPFTEWVFWNHGAPASDRTFGDQAWYVRPYAKHREVGSICVAVVDVLFPYANIPLASMPCAAKVGSHPHVSTTVCS